MKRLLTFIAAAALVLSASVAMAAVTTTGHDFAGVSTYGLCQVCHVPHAAGTGKRLWREVLVIANDGSWTKSTVGMLCGTCHISTGVLNGQANRWGTAAHDLDNTAYDSASVTPSQAHGRRTNELTANIKDAWINGTVNGKPYTNGTKIEAGLMECTSCHNPHDPTVRPFLRAGATAGATGTISGVCADCHNRYTTAVGVTNTQTWNGAAASMHPVDKAYANDAANGATTFRATPDAALTGIVTDTHSWSLGGKFQSSAGAALGVVAVGATDQIGCQTCHAIHGKPGSMPAAGSEQASFLLAINNASATAALLCEGCHGGPQNATNVGAGADHPIDVTLPNGGPVIDKWYGTVAGSPGAGQNVRYERHGATVGYWPRAGLIIDTVKTGGKIVCTSCHSAHNGRPTKTLTRKGGPAGDTGAAGEDFCTSCHSDAGPLAHHSNTSNWPGQSIVACNDCHGAAGAGAHNGFGYTKNGPWVTGGTNELSQLCVSCHLGVVGGGAGTAVQLAKDPVHQLVPTSYLEAQKPGGVAGGSGSTYKSHYLGVFADVAANSIQTKRSTWNGIGFSKYGGPEQHGEASDPTGTTMICESCHSVLGNLGRPGNTVGMAVSQSSGYNNNLLLQKYTDDGAPVAGGVSANGGTAIGSGFCIGCHNQNNVGTTTVGPVADNLISTKVGGIYPNTPANMHPMTGWTITKAADAGRVPTSLITGGATYANNAGRTVAYPAADAMDCDSCHRPHKADANGTWQPTYKAAAVNVILEMAGPGAGKYDNLCANCHAY